MPASLSLDLRRRIVQAYLDGRSGTYAQTAQMFGVGEATVSRLLRAHRKGCLNPMPRGGGQRRKVDLQWLLQHAQDYPDATLAQRIQALAEQGGPTVCSSTMSAAMKAIGWTYKKKHPQHANSTDQMWSPRDSAFKSDSPDST